MSIFHPSHSKKAKNTHTAFCNKTPPLAPSLCLITSLNSNCELRPQTENAAMPNDG